MWGGSNKAENQNSQSSGSQNEANQVVAKQNS